MEKTKKEELAENYAHNYFDMHDNEYNYKALKRGFLAGWEAREPKWINVEEQTPEEGKPIIIKTFDYRRPKENVTDITLGYFENGNYFYDSGGHVNDGNGWMIISYMEFTQ